MIVVEFSTTDVNLTMGLAGLNKPFALLYFSFLDVVQPQILYY
jgi:hypothetical protein